MARSVIVLYIGRLRSEYIALSVVDAFILGFMQKIWREKTLFIIWTGLSKLYTLPIQTNVSMFSFSQAEEYFVSFAQSVATLQRADRTRRMFCDNSIGSVKMSGAALVSESDDGYRGRHN
jgi:hypothetical protein